MLVTVSKVVYDAVQVMSVWTFKQMILSAQLKKGPISAHPRKPTSSSLDSFQHRSQGSGATAAPATVTDIIYEKQHRAGQAQGDSFSAASVEQEAQRPADNAANLGRMQTDYLFHFGDTTEVRKALEMPNRLTGWASAAWL